jgi:putative selenate reductase
LVPIAHPLWIHQAGTRNSRALAKASLEDPRYRRDKNDKAPKKIGRQLVLFDCTNCDKCVPVCPNDANFVYQTAPKSGSAPTWILADGKLELGPRVEVRIGEEHQLATYVDFCNACGNCDVFCPEDGGPYVVKPHWFGGPDAFAQEPLLDGFYLESKDAIVGRFAGRRVALRVDRSTGRLLYETEAAELVLDVELSVEDVRPKIEGRHELRGDLVMILSALLDGVQRTVNPVSAGLR